MGERISLLVMLSGVALALYWLGIPATWVLVLLVMSMVGADIMLLKERMKNPARRETPSPAKVEAANSPKEDAMTDYGGKDDESEPAWKRFSITRIPANRGLNDTTVHAVARELNSDQSSQPSPPSPRIEVCRADNLPEAAKHAPERNPITPEKTPVDPLAIYQPKQFDAPPRAAPVAESPPPVAIPPISMPTGPAYLPPAARPIPDRAARSPATRRLPRPILKPEDFTRNAGKRGFLYLARNPEHWDGLFKVGQTVNHPSIRVGQLNTLHAKHKDIGTFELLDVVEVADAYGAEQVLFLVLSDLRPVLKREFFIADKAYLSKVMRAVADFISGRPDVLNNLYRDLDPNDFPAWPGYVQRHYYRSVRNARGWVYLARNQYHKADTYLFGSTRNSPQSEVDALNAGQRTDTPQIGFFTVVFALPVRDTKASRTIGWRALAPWKLHGSRSFVRGPLALINRALTDSLHAAAGHQRP